MTTADLIEGLVKFTIAIVAPIAGAVIWLNAREKRLAEQAKAEIEVEKIKSAERIAIAKENSAGATAIIGLVEKNDKIQKDVGRLEEKMNSQDKDLRERVKELSEDIMEYTLQVISLFKK